MNKNLNKSAYSLFARSKYDYAQEVQNLRCAFLCELSTRARAFFLSLVMAMTVLTVTGIAGMNVYAETGTVYVATYDQLREALEDTQGVKTIVVDPQAAEEDGEVTYTVENDEDNGAFYIGFDGPLTVSHDITITTADDVDVFFARSDSFRRDQGKPALFNIDRTGSLELDGLITMTGEEVTTAYNDREFVFSIKSRDGTGEDNDAWNRGQVLQGGFYIQNNGGEYNLGEDVILEDFHTTDDVEGVEPIFEKETNSLFGAKKSDEEATEEKEEETVVAPAPKRLMKSAAPQQRNGGTPNYTPNDTTDTKTVATSAQLEAALNDPAVTTIIVDPTGALALDQVQNKDANGNINPQEPNVVGNKFYLPVDKPLTIAQNSTNNRTVTIKTKEDANGDPKEAIIARSDLFTPSSTNPGIFNVPKGVTLTLDSNITMTGDKVTSKYKDGTNSSYDPGKTYVAATVAPVEVTSDTGNLYLGASTSTAGNFDLKVFNSATGYKFEIGDDGRLICYKPESTTPEYIKCDNNWTLRLTTDSTAGSSMGDKDLRVRDLSGNNIEKLEANQTYVLYNTNYNCYLKNENGSLKRANDIDDATKFKAGGGSGAGSSGSANSGQAYKKVTFDYTVESTTWKASDIPGTDYRGFFINAADGGTVKIQGNVTLQNLKTKTALKSGSVEKFGHTYSEPYTDDTVTNVAPIYIGAGSTLEMSGGEIKNNRVGYGALESDSSSSIQWLNNKLGKDTYPSNTAGGIIVSGTKATATINGTAKITNNQADAGGLIVKDGALVTMDSANAEISSNIGWHHSGGVLVENNGTFRLQNGKINDNIAWGKGGAVWATEWGTNAWVRWASYPNSIKNTEARQAGGNFIMTGGELKRNFAFMRGGAIEVESNGVQLVGGTIAENKCKSLGGGIYIEGDSPVYTYGLVLQEGYISGNTAVQGADATNLDKGIKDNELHHYSDKPYPANGGAKYHYDADFAGWDADGDGGGVWLCSMGGTSIFTSSGPDENNVKYEVIIDENNADRSGDDFFVSAKKGSALIQHLNGTWYYDGGKEVEKIDAAQGRIITGRKGLYNGTDPIYEGGPGIQIIDNMARDGGGIACNGTVVLGKAENIYRYEAELEFQKIWDRVQAHNVTIGLYYHYDETADAENKCKLNDKCTNEDHWHQLTANDGNTENASTKYEITLGPGSSSANTNDQRNPDATNVIYKVGQDNEYKAKASIPAYTKHDGVDVPLFKIKKNGTNDFYNLENKQDRIALYNYIDTNKGSDGFATLDIVWNLKLVESGGENYTTTLSPLTAKGKASITNTVSVSDSAGKEVDSFQVFFSTFTFGQTLTNSPSATSVTLTKVSADNTNKAIRGTKFIVAEISRDDEGTDRVSPDFRVAHDAGAWNPSSENTSKSILDVAQRDESGSLKIYESSADGTFTVNNLTPGKRYFLFEYEPTAGYEAVSTPWLLDVVSNDEVSVLAIDPEANLNGDSAINKVKRNVQGNGDYLDEFGVKNGGTSSHNHVKNSVYRTYWPTDWFYNTTNNGKTIGSAKNEVTDKKLRNNAADIKILKTAKNGTTPVQGAKFAFTDVAVDDNDKLNFGKGGMIKTSQNDAKAIIVSSNQQGEISLKDIIKALRNTSNGEVQGYHINAEEINLLMFEVEAPGIYKMDNSPWLININREGVVTIKEYKDRNAFGQNPPISATGSWQVTRDNYNGEVSINDFTTISTSTLTKAANVTNDTNTYEVEKVDFADETVPVNGAEFDLYKVDPEKYTVTGSTPSGRFQIKDATPVNGDTKLVSANGKITLPISEEGAYLLFETSAPNGYVRALTPWGIYVDGKTVKTYRIKDGAVEDVIARITDGNGNLISSITNIYVDCTEMNVPGKIANKKFDVELTKKNLDGEPVNGAVFELYEVKDLPEGKTVENLIDADWTTTFNANNWDMAKVNDNRVGAGTEIKSKDGGKISLPITKKGVYFLFETTAASSEYVTPVDPWVIVVSDYGKVVVRKSDGNAKTNTRWWKAYKYTKLTGTEITNTKQIKINKVKGEFNSEGNLELETDTPVNNAKFKLYNASEDDTNITRGTAVSNTEISSTNGIISLPQSLSLQGGKKLYWLEETAAAPGYVKADKPWVLWVQDGQLKVIYRYKEYAGNNTVANNITNRVEAYTHGTDTTPYIHNEQYILKVDKNDTSYVLPNAKFKLYHAMLQTASGSSKVIIRRGNDNRFICNLESDSQGRIYLPTDKFKEATTKIEDPNYPKDSTVWNEGYVLVEEKAPGGYVKPKAPWWITVGTDGKITVKTTTSEPYAYSSYQSLPNWDVSNYTEATKNSDGAYLAINTQGNVGLTKKDGITKAALKGAVFKQYNASLASGSYNYKLGSFIDYTAPSGDNGFFALASTGPEPQQGKTATNMFFLFEHTAPSGYAISEKPWLVVVYKESRWVSNSVGYKTFTSVDVFPHIGNTTGETPGTVYHVECGEYNDTIYNYPSVNLIKADADTVNIGSNIGDLTTDEQTKFLEGVEFRLFEATRNTNGVWSWNEKSPIETVKLDSDGKTVKNVVIKSNKNGVVELGTLKKNSYYVLKEVAPIDGYIKPDKEWRILTDEDGKLFKLRVWDGTKWIDGRLASEDGTTAVCNIIVNTKVYNLPSTGGMGTYWFMIIGMGMMTFAVTTLLTRKFEKKKL